MKVRNYIASIGMFAATLSTGAFAHHQGNDPIMNLRGESQRLNRTVYYTQLNSGVKNSVSRFARDVERLFRCAEGGFNMTDHHEEGQAVPPQCRHVLYRLQSDFRRVEYYLGDTQYDYPQVYEIYTDTRESLYDVK